MGETPAGERSRQRKSGENKEKQTGACICPCLLEVKISVNTLFGAVVCIWFILNEALFILENINRMGVKIPTFLHKAILYLQKKSKMIIF